MKEAKQGKLGKDESAEDIVREAKQHYKDSHANDYIERDRVISDLEFAYDPERQWDEYVKQHRTDRPCLSYNRIEPAIDQIVGDQLRTDLGINIKPNETGDKHTAETLAGLIRNIELNSVAGDVYDEQFEHAVGGGFGCWRILNDYNNDENFDQDILLEGIRNPASEVWFDQAALKWHKQDGNHVIITKWISEDDFERLYPNNTPNSWETYKDDEYWRLGKLINVAEYYRKKWVDRTLIQLSDGRVRWKDEIKNIIPELENMGLKIENERKVKTYVMQWFKLTGWDVLDGPIEYNWRYFPVVPVYGKRRIIRNREQYKGITRNARDPQKSYNYQRSSIVEAVAMTPKSPYLVTTKMIEPFKKLWKNLNKTNNPYLPYQADPKVPEGPKRQDFQQVPASMIALTQLDADDIRATTGIHDPSLGVQQGPQQSGEAIGAVLGQGETGSFRYIDNLRKSIEMTGRILVDMIPTVYDTERTVRILGADGSEEVVDINGKDDQGNPVNDLQTGKYDVAVTVGPTHATQRQAAAQFLERVIPSNPMLQELAMDIVFKYQDIPGADEIHERLRRAMISQGKIQPESEEEQQWAPQGPSEAEKLLMQQQIAEVMNTEADTKTKLAKVMQSIADAYKTQMEGAEIEVTLAADAMIGADNIAQLEAGLNPQGNGQQQPGNNLGAPPGVQ